MGLGLREKVIIINSGKCAWGGCTYCGWGRLVAKKKNMHELKKFWDEQVSDIKPSSIDRIKIFNSGCFLDAKQIEPAFRSYAVRSCEKLGVKSLIVESFPKFITPENLENMQSSKVKILAGIGLEVADDEGLKLVQKGFTLKEFADSHEILRKFGWGIRAYLLVNAPKCEKVSLAKTVAWARKHAEEIILINTLPHYAAPIMDFWLNGEWRPLDRKQFNEAVAPFESFCETDFENFTFVPTFPLRLKKKIRGATEDALKHPAFEVWQDFLCRFWKPSKEKEILFFIPCAFRKPYPNSQLHRAIMSVAGRAKDFEKMQFCVISTPGVIPLQFSQRYPFDSYDWPEWEETEEIKKIYMRITEERVENFLRAHAGKYKKIISYFKPHSESFFALQQACEKLNLKLENLISERDFEKVSEMKNPLAQEGALECLARGLGVKEVTISIEN